MRRLLSLRKRRDSLKIKSYTCSQGLGAVSEGTGQQKPSTLILGALLPQVAKRGDEVHGRRRDPIRPPHAGRIARRDPEVLSLVQRSGLPGEHHLYIAFDTGAEGISVSKRLKEQYPEEMTIVLQYQFWDLQVTNDRFEVKLSFGSVPEKLVVPFQAVKAFYDPSAQFGLQFGKPDAANDVARPAYGGGAPRSRGRPGRRKPPAQRRSTLGARPLAASRRDPTGAHGERRAAARRRGGAARPLPQEIDLPAGSPELQAQFLLAAAQNLGVHAACSRAVA